MKTLLKGGILVTMDPGRGIYEGDLLIEDDHISSLASAGSVDETRVDQVLDCRGKIIIPGLVSAHSHLTGIYQRGLWDETSFESWSAKTFAVDRLTDFSAEEIYLLHCAAAVELLRHGVTTVLDMFTAHPGGALDKVEATGKALADTGMRGVVAYSFRDRSPDNQGISVVSASAEEVIDGARRAAERVAGFGPRVGFMPAPSAPQRCSDALLGLTRKLAREIGTGIHTHLAETKSHAEIGRSIYGEPMVAHLERVGFLGSDLSVAHAIWLEDEEINLLSEHGVKVVHNPASNMKLGSGIARVKEMIGSGLSVGLGADSVNAGTVHSIFEQMKLAALAPRCVWGPEKWVLPEEALEMATLGGARALLLEAEIGSIETGKKADLVVLNPSFSLSPMNDLANQLVFAENGESVESVLVDGKPLMLERRLRTLEEEELRVRLSSLGKRIREARAEALSRSGG